MSRYNILTTAETDMAKAKKLLKTAKEKAAAIKDAKMLARQKQKQKDKVLEK